MYFDEVVEQNVRKSLCCLIDRYVYHFIYVVTYTTYNTDTPNSTSNQNDLKYVQRNWSVFMYITSVYTTSTQCGLSIFM